MTKHGNLTYVTRIDPATEKHVPAEGLRKVFVSYKKSDNIISGKRDIVIRKILRMVNCAVWYDDNLTPGDEFDKEIIQAITECDAVVLLLTRDILHSDYVWNIEIATAKQQKKGIIPIAFGISAEDFEEAKRRLGDKMQIMRWPTEGEKGEISDDAMKFDDDFLRGLERFVINSDLALRVERFFASGKHNVPIKDLTAEQRYIMGYGYIKGLSPEQNVEKGVKLLDSIAHIYADDEETLELKATAALVLDSYYYDLDDFESSVRYSEIGAEAGNADAIRRLGYAYRYGEGVEQNLEKAAELYGRAADMGDAKAINNLGLMYEFGRGVEMNKEKAVELYAKASELGHAAATCNLGWMYEFGEGVEKDEVKAVELYAKSADMGHPRGIKSLGIMYSSGKGVEKNVPKAAELFEKAAELGEVSAMTALGVLYIIGEDGITRNVPKAVALLSKAAEMGSEDAKSALDILAKNPELNDEPEEKTEADVGEDILPDEDAKEFRKEKKDSLSDEEKLAGAAEEGDADAMTMLGLMYLIGEGVEQDIPKAVDLLGKAAEMGSDDAMEALEMLAEMAEDSEGETEADSAEIDDEDAKGKELYEAAMGDDNPDATTALGLMYLMGEGVEQDIPKAVALLTKGMKLGSNEAKRALDILFEASAAEETEEEAPAAQAEEAPAEEPVKLTPREARKAKAEARKAERAAKKEAKRAEKLAKREARRKK